MLLRSLILLLIFSIKVYSNEIPIITITAPSKKPQSISTVGTSVTILNEEFFNNSTEHFLGDALSTSITSANFFQKWRTWNCISYSIERGCQKDIQLFI